ncbi:hypothetical protein RFI_14413 [Reticulomyxa filosa]|uniref:Uncharacterized protein n=1 Tax=Reticulomyxa filosa TaxID=46433 RepID=X6N910_RETFI|nr:hypothetical protein RFI_14413 [Reticulomyxa filosa]|eukprot:ETO22780.1 hypothetical protein RFI_14413 [Reticulomyxa filosa]
MDKDSEMDFEKIGGGKIKAPRVYYVRVEPTAPNALVYPSVQGHTYVNSNEIDESEKNWQELQESIKTVASNGLIKNMPIRGDRQSTLSDLKIREALDLPTVPPLPMDALVQSQISTCSFYKNHQPPYMSHSVSWRPRGRVVAQLTEHKDSVNVMRVSRDNTFVATASSDKTVKIWSCSKIRNNANVKCEQTYTHQKGEIISMTLLDSSHTIACGSREGTIHLFRVEHTRSEHSGEIFGALQDKFKLDPEEGAVVCMEHFNTTTESMLVFGTHAGNIHGWDIRKKASAWTLEMEPAMGPITAMCVGPSIWSCVVGTARGFIVVWDLRFEFPVQMWHHYDHSPIVSLTILDSPTVMRYVYIYIYVYICPLLFVSTERTNELCAFDLISGQCVIRFRMSKDGSTLDTPNLSSVNENIVKTGTLRTDTLDSNNTPRTSDKAAKESLENDIANSIDNLDRTVLSSKTSTGNIQSGSTSALGFKIPHLPIVYPPHLQTAPAIHHFSRICTEPSIISPNRFLYNCGYVPTILNSQIHTGSITKELESLCADFGREKGGVTGVLISKDNFVVTAGRDRVVRYWNLVSPQKSFRISSTETSHQTYRYQAYRDEKYDEIVFDELIDAHYEHESEKGTQRWKSMRDGTLKAQHQDVITDLKAVEFPQIMLLTAGRNGVVKVWI